MKKSNLFKKMLSMVLVCFMLVSLLASVPTEYSAATDSWKNFYYVNSRGAYCYNRYIYPSKAKQYQVPEYCFQRPGTFHSKGTLGTNAYTVITVEDTSSYPNNNSNNRYLDSHFIVWTNEVQQPNLVGKGVPAVGKAALKVLYCSPGMRMQPTSDPMISIKLNDDNPNLYTDSKIEFSTMKYGKVNFVKLVGDAVVIGVNIETGRYARALSKVAGWGKQILKSGNLENKESMITEIYADEYGDDLPIQRSLGVSLSGAYLSEPNNRVMFHFTEVFPKDAPVSYNKNKNRSAQARFVYEFKGGGKSVTYTDIYDYSYCITTTNIGASYNINSLYNSKDITLSGVNSTYYYTGSAFKPAVTLKHRNTKLVNGEDYTVSYKNNKEVGTATITITGKGNYSGTITKTFSIKLKAPTINSLTSKSNTSTQLTWSTVTGASGYEIYRMAGVDCQVELTHFYV